MIIQQSQPKETKNSSVYVQSSIIRLIGLPTVQQFSGSDLYTDYALTAISATTNDFSGCLLEL